MARPRPSLLYASVGVVGRALAHLLWRRSWRGEKLPAGPFIVVSNHLSNLDPIMLGHYLVHYRIYPRFLAKDSLFQVPLLRAGLHRLGVIPVARGTATSGQALVPAVAALQAGHVVVIYPEGTFTDDPDLWPMRGKTGAVRLALQAGVPIVPIAQWGPQRVLPPRQWRLRIWPRQTIDLIVGAPIDAAHLVSQYAPASPGDQPSANPTPEAVRYATDQVMAQLTELVRQLRSEAPG